MDWRLLAPLLVTSVVTIVGWLAAHQLAAWRDRASKRREQRIEYLVEAFRRLAKAVHHPRLYEVAEEVQSAVADIYLFRSREQIVRVESFVKDLSANREAPLDELLDALRNDLRTELRLPRVGGPIWWLRIEPKSNDKH
jgi:hypothetical protein